MQHQLLGFLFLQSGYGIVCRIAKGEKGPLAFFSAAFNHSQKIKYFLLSFCREFKHTTSQPRPPVGLYVRTTSDTSDSYFVYWSTIFFVLVFFIEDHINYSKY